MYSANRSLKRLADAAFTTPIIDHHAHNLLSDVHRSAVPFEGLTSEASGKALSDAVHSVAFYKAIAQLARLFNCEPTLQAVKAARDALPYENLCELCLRPTGIVSFLLDDGLDKIDEICCDIPWHDRFVPVPVKSKRIVRVEVLAQTLMRELHSEGRFAFRTFNERFESLLVEMGNDPHVVAFKSVVCYRTGLNIEMHKETEIETEYSNAMGNFKTTRNLRLAHKALNDHIVRTVLRIAGQLKKPVQFHTGLGDNDIRLVSASPASMQPVIIEFPDTDIVLLHSSYPFTREAGYLAAVYKNVYLDFGEVFPIVSAEGQRAILRQVLEFAPSTKVLWSTDGHWWPESFYLAVVQVREALYEVLSDSVARGDISELQAVDIAERLLFHNANALYGLKLEIPAVKLCNPLQLTHSGLAPRAPTLDSLAARGIRFVRIYFIDYCSIIRTRIVPIARLQKMLASHVRPGVTVTKALLPMVRLKVPPSIGPSGEYLLVADLNTLRICPFAEGHAFAMGTFEEKDPVTSVGGHSSSEVDVDPRTILKRVVTSAKNQNGLNFLVGFEIEFILLMPDRKFPAPVDEYDYGASNALLGGSAAAKTLNDISEALESCGIELQQYHSEAAEGQFEVVTGPLPPMEAVDALILTREIILNTAAKNGLQATFTPRLFSHTCGSGLHAHISLTSTSPRASTLSKDAPISEVEASFLQSVLDHLPALCAFSLTSPASYDRVKDGIWSGGSWVAWGRDNREVPIRLCGNAVEGWHFEVKPLDATGNPYLAIAALLYAGTLGVKGAIPLRTRDCQIMPASLSPEERDALGITTRMSLNLEQAIENLRKDKEITSMFGEQLISTYIGSLEIRQNLMSKFTDEQQREWMAKFY